jgi:hypothetical protein
VKLQVCRQAAAQLDDQAAAHGSIHKHKPHAYERLRPLLDLQATSTLLEAMPILHQATKAMMAV